MCSFLQVDKDGRMILLFFLILLIRCRLPTNCTCIFAFSHLQNGTYLCISVSCTPRQYIFFLHMKMVACSKQHKSKKKNFFVQQNYIEKSVHHRSEFKSFKCLFDAYSHLYTIRYLRNVTLTDTSEFPEQKKVKKNIQKNYFINSNCVNCFITVPYILVSPFNFEMKICRL